MRELVPIPIISELAVDADVESDTFRGNHQGLFTLDIRANHGEGTQDLVGTFYLRHRASNGEMERVDGFDFGDQPAGTVYRWVEEFKSASAGEYDVEFVYTSGEGDIDVSYQVPGGIL